MKYNLPAALCWLTGILANSIILDSKNFTSAIKKGTWFVKFYAPWCRYSKKLAPEWVILSNTLEHLKEKSFYFGEVDCNSNGRTCNNNNIDGYPTLKLFHKGKLIEEFNQDSVLELTANYISPYAIKKAKQYYKEPKKPKKPREHKKSVIKVDPPKASNEPMDSGFVVELDPKGFNSTNLSLNPWTVLFYSPTCPHCQALEPLYIDAALKSKHRMNFAKVNCIEYGDFCREKQVSGVPDMRILLQGKQLDKNVGELSLGKLIKFVQKYYVPKTVKKTLEEAQSITLQATSTKPVIILVFDSKDRGSDFKGILSNLVGAGLKSEIILIEDKMAIEAFKLKSSVAMFAAYGSKVIEFTHLKGSPSVLRAWAASVDFPLASKLDFQTISSFALENYHLVVGMNVEATQDADLAKLKDFTLESNIQYLQTLGQAPAFTNVSLVKPVIFTYINGSITSDPQKSLLSKLNIPFEEVQKHSHATSPNSLLLLVDSSAHKYFYLAKGDGFSVETTSSSIMNFQQAKLEAYPLIEEKKGANYIFYVIAAVLVMGALAWYFKKAKAEPEISYHRL